MNVTLVRFVLVLAAVVVAPGAAVAHRVRSGRTATRNRQTVTALSFSFGIAWLVLASEVLLYLHWWKPAALIPASAVFVGLMMAAPARGRHQSKEARRSGAVFNVALLAGGWLVALHVWAIYRAPYRRDELASLRAAWSRSRGLMNGENSALSLVYQAVVPLHRPNVGTLLAARWLTFGIVCVVVLLAARWSRSLTERPNATVFAFAFAFAPMLVSAVFAGRFVGVSVELAPLILGAGLCLVGAERWRARFLFAGVLLGLAAASSITGIACAAMMVVWFVLNVRSADSVRGVARFRSAMLAVGMGCSLAGTIICAHIFSFPVPVLMWGETLAAPTTWVTSARTGSVALLAVGVLLADLAGSWSERRRRARIRRHHLPLFALIGVGLGALVDRRPVAQTLPLFAVLAAIALTALVGSSESGLRIRMSRLGEPGKHRRAVDPWRRAPLAFGLAGVFVVVASMLSIRVAMLSNKSQTDQIAYVLQRTSEHESVYDPSQLVAIFRQQSERADIGGAAFAVVSPAELERDARLRDTLRNDGFGTTEQSDIWAAPLSWGAPVSVRKTLAFVDVDQQR